ncbi:hypothetical protein FHX42_001258 [Saccharopolyspora lacisalsi]|uniref:DUF2637 domain-containing protein n=1 Tax=Halosaccharopolyspora lacisalsi TaxID=1000566 RepID=A0A839DT51_9PSEU|nr:DUF2637 domain-containing protein [Halosaccharopolyspora lacisalsi]MBA8823929.1 hypothetical protein [Halosaccharopolyspora lacisalsi]
MSTAQQAAKRSGLWLSRAALSFVALAAVMGWGASFVGLHAYGLDQMVGFSYWTAWLVPGTFDGAAFGATLITYRASIYGRSAVRGRLLMWTFTAISSWINWIHQISPEARIVAAGLPIAAVAVFDVVLAELRADYEERHGKRRLRLRPGLLLLRWMLDRDGTSSAFRQQVTDIPVSEIAGLAVVAHESAEEPTVRHTPHQLTTSAAKVSAVRHDPHPGHAEPAGSASTLAPTELATGQHRSAEPTSLPEQTPPQPPPAAPGPELADSDDEPTQHLPPVPAEGEIADEDKRTFARRDYRLSLEAGEPLTGGELGRRYGYSERWGRRQIAAARLEIDDSPHSDADQRLVSMNN